MNSNRFTAENAIMLLIEHQVGSLSGVRSSPINNVKRNVLMLAEAARILKFPVIMSSSSEDKEKGPLISELAQILPEAFAMRIRRTGVLMRWRNGSF